MKELLSYSIWVLAWLPVGFIVDFPLTGVMGWFSALFMYKQGYWLWGRDLIFPPPEFKRRLEGQVSLRIHNEKLQTVSEIRSLFSN